MEIILWVVRGIGDCEGRTLRDIAAFSTEVEANRFADSDQGRDMYGGRGDVIKRVLICHETAEDAGAKTWKRRGK